MDNDNDSYLVTEDECRLSAALSAMEASLDALPPDLKREYLQALEILPHLVADESDASVFLRCENFQPAAAARRLCLYWKHRKTVFGQRWLLPMVQTGSGALTGQAIALLRQGFISLLPGLPVILVDASRRTGPTADHVVAAMAFYLATTIIAKDPAMQQQGVTLLHLIADNGHWNVNPKPTGYWTVIKDALPFQIKQILMVPSHVPGKQVLLDYLSFQTSRLVEARSNRSSQIVAAKTKHETAQRLLSIAGISRIQLPVCLGGNFDQQAQVHHWIRARLSVEESMSAACPILNQIHAQRGSSQSILRRKRPTTPDFNSPQEKRDYIRQRNALYSRRKYHKHKLDLLTLPDRAKSLQERNGALKLEQARLLSLVASAKALVGLHVDANQANHTPVAASTTTTDGILAVVTARPRGMLKMEI